MTSWSKRGQYPNGEANLWLSYRKMRGKKKEPGAGREGVYAEHLGR